METHPEYWRVYDSLIFIPDKTPLKPKTVKHQKCLEKIFVRKIIDKQMILKKPWGQRSLLIIHGNSLIWHISHSLSSWSLIFYQDFGVPHGHSEI